MFQRIELVIFSIIPSLPGSERMGRKWMMHIDVTCNCILSVNGIHSNYSRWSTQLISLLYINVLASLNSDFEQCHRNFKCLMVAILKILNGSYHKNQLKCALISYDCIYIYTASQEYTKCHAKVQSCRPNNLEFLEAAIWKIRNGG